MKPFSIIDACLGIPPVPWSVPTIGTGFAKSGRRFRFTKRDKKTNLDKRTLNYEHWLDAVRTAANNQHEQGVYDEGPVHLDLAFYFPLKPGKKHGQVVDCDVTWDDDGLCWRKADSHCPDLTNLSKGVEDALEEIVYANDCQVRSKTEAMLYGISPGVFIRVYLLEESDYPGEGSICESPPPPARRKKDMDIAWDF